MKDVKSIAYSLLNDLLDWSGMYDDGIEQAISHNTDLVMTEDKNHSFLLRGSDDGYLIWLCVQIINHSEDCELGELYRQIGFIQGSIVEKGYNTTSGEDDRARE